MSHCQVVEFHSGAPPGWPVEFGNPPKVSAGRGTGAFAVPRGRAQLGHLLQVAIQYGGMDVSMMARVKELEEENRRLKKMYAESQMDSAILKEALTKKW